MTRLSPLLCTATFSILAACTPPEEIAPASGATSGAASASSAASTANGVAQWSVVPSADGSKAEKHAEGSFAHTDGKLVLLGGRGEPRTDIFDMASCIWTKGSAAPFQIHHFQAVAVNGDVYAIGAFTGGYPREDPIPIVMIYNIASDSWREGPQIPQDRRRGAAASVRMGEWIYIIGGAQIGHVGGHVAWTDRFNIVSGEWQRLADAPRKRDHTAAAVAGDKIVLAGGRLSKAPEQTFQLTIPQIDIYDPATNSWSTSADPLPTPRAGLAAATYKASALFLGGESVAQTTAHREVEGHMPGQGGVSLPDMPEGSHGFGAATRVENGTPAIYTTGGVITRGGGPAWQDLVRYGAGKGPCGAQ